MGFSHLSAGKGYDKISGDIEGGGKHGEMLYNRGETSYNHFDNKGDFSGKEMKNYELQIRS